MDRKEIQYFGRHLVLPNFGTEGQQTLKDAHVVVVGAGGLGSSCIIHLASVGVGRLSIIDYDVVDFTNLHRQVIYGVASVGRLKVDVATERCADLNPFCTVKGYPARLDPSLCDQLFQNCSLIVDCVDNLPTRLLISDGATKFHKPVVSGSALRTHGQLLKYNLSPDCSDNYRSLLYPTEKQVDNAVISPSESQSCNDQGVLGPVPGLIGTLMALEVIKILQKKTTADNFYTFNWLAPKNPFQTYTLKPKGQPQAFIYMPQDDYYHVNTCSVSASTGATDTVEWAELIQDGILAENGVVSSQYCSIDVRPRTHSDVWTLKGSNFAYPLDTLKYDVRLIRDELTAGNRGDLLNLPFCGPMKQLVQRLNETSDDSNNSSNNSSAHIKPGALFVFCKRGVSSKQACKLLLDLATDCLNTNDSNINDSNINDSNTNDSSSNDSSSRRLVVRQFIHQQIYNVNGGVLELCSKCPGYDGCLVV